MKSPTNPSRYPLTITLGVAAALALMTNVLLMGAEARPKNTAHPPAKTQKQPKKKLSGPELYALHCNRCHPERYAPERTDAQWETILLHMRTRANLPAAQARAILNYLKEDSGK